MEDIIARVAKLHGVSIEECQQEMQTALDAAGIDLSPEVFIALCAAKAVEQSTKHP